MSTVIDTHSHIHFEAYSEDREAVIARAREAEVKMIAVGTDLQSSRAALAIAEQFGGDIVGTTIGLHPTYTEEFNAGAFRELAVHGKVLGVGECGLDYYHVTDPELRRKQQEVLRRHIALSYSVGKPLVVHCRSAFPDLIQIFELERNDLHFPNAGVVHFFSGTPEDAQKLIGFGFYLGFGGVITFSRDYDEVLKKIPGERILIETDAPYIAPVPYRGKRNEPAYIRETLKKIAEIRGENEDVLAGQLFQNTKRLFSLN